MQRLEPHTLPRKSLALDSAIAEAETSRWANEIARRRRISVKHRPIIKMIVEQIISLTSGICLARKGFRIVNFPRPPAMSREVS